MIFLLTYAILPIAGLAFCAWLGSFAGKRRDEEGSRMSSLLESTLFSVFGLLLAFTLSGAAGRLETRRMASIDEANAIGTACLRISLVTEPHRQALVGFYGEYIDNRLRFNDALSQGSLAGLKPPLLPEIQASIWKESVAGTDGANRILVIDSVNQLFDSSATRETRTQIFTPVPLLVLLVALAALCSFFVGLETGRLPANAWLYRGLFVLIIAASLFVIVDLDNPRVGLIRMNEVDSMLSSTRQLLQQPTGGPPVGAIKR